MKYFLGTVISAKRKCLRGPGFFSCILPSASQLEATLQHLSRVSSHFGGQPSELRGNGSEVWFASLERSLDIESLVSMAMVQA